MRRPTPSRTRLRCRLSDSHLRPRQPLRPGHRGLGAAARRRAALRRLRDRRRGPADGHRRSSPQLMADAAGSSRTSRCSTSAAAPARPACHLAGEHGARVTGITTSAVGVDAAHASVPAAAGLADRVDASSSATGWTTASPDASFDRVWVLESSHLMRERERARWPSAPACCARAAAWRCATSSCAADAVRGGAPAARAAGAAARGVRRRPHGAARRRYAEPGARTTGSIVDAATDLTAATRPTFDRWRDNAERHRDEVRRARSARTTGERFVESCDVLEGFWDDGTLGYGLIAASKP